MKKRSTIYFFSLFIYPSLGASHSSFIYHMCLNGLNFSPSLSFCIPRNMIIFHALKPHMENFNRGLFEEDYIRYNRVLGDLFQFWGKKNRRMTTKKRWKVRKIEGCRVFCWKRERLQAITQHFYDDIDILIYL